MTDPTPEPRDSDGVHRLVDMVVEEVSLVDRAANKHRFLIVKKDDAMDDSTLTEVTTVVAGSPDPSEGTGAAIDDDSPLGAAIAALESLTDMVELLSALGGEETDPRLGALAGQLATASAEVLARIGVGTEEDAEPVAARAPDADAGASKTLHANLASAKAAVQRLALRRAKPAPKNDAPEKDAPEKDAPEKDAPEEDAPEGEQPQDGESEGDKPKVGKPKACKPKVDKGVEQTSEASALAKNLASLSESFRALSDTVKQQQQRLGRMEKQFGLPNSAAPAEHVSKAAPEEVGWPLDLNKPMDRENVDKALSFHDL